MNDLNLKYYRIELVVGQAKNKDHGRICTAVCFVTFIKWIRIRNAALVF